MEHSQHLDPIQARSDTVGNDVRRARHHEFPRPLNAPGVAQSGIGLQVVDSIVDAKDDRSRSGSIIAGDEFRFAVRRFGFDGTLVYSRINT